MIRTDPPPVLRMTTQSLPDLVQAVVSDGLVEGVHATAVGLRGDDLLIASPIPLPENTRLAVEKAARRPVQPIACTWSDSYRRRDHPFGRQPADPLEARAIAGLLEGVAGPDLEDGFRQRLDRLVLDGFSHYLPHLRLEKWQARRGLELLLPADIPLEHFVPLGWVDGVLFCLVDAPEWADLFADRFQNQPYACQFILADADQLKQAYQSLVLHGPASPSPTDRDVIEVLVGRGKLSQEQAAAVLDVEQQSAGSARDVLIQRGIVDGDAWLSARAELVRIPPILMAMMPVDLDQLLKSARGLIPGWVLRKFHLLPLARENGTLVLAVADLNRAELELAGAISGLEIEPRLMNQKQIDTWLEKIYPPATESGHATLFHFEHFLVRMGYIQAEQVNPHPHPGARGWLDELVESGSLADEDLTAAMSLAYGIPLVSLDRIQLDRELIGRMPYETLSGNTMLPLYETSSTIWVAAADPFCADAFQQAEEISGKRVAPVLAERTVLQQLIGQCSPEKSIHDSKDDLGGILDTLVVMRVIKRVDAAAVLEMVAEGRLAFIQAVGQKSDLAEEAIVQLIAKKLNIPFEDLVLREISRPVISPLGEEVTRIIISDPVEANAAHLIQLETARRLNALPIRVEPERVIVAFGNYPFEPDLESIGRILGKPVQAVMTTRLMLDEAISRTLGRPNLGTTLLKAGMISRTQLSDALGYARRMNIRLGKALVLKRYITESALYQFLARQTQLPFFDLSHAHLDENAARLLDARFERANGILPVAGDEHKVILAVTDPHQREGVEKARAVLDRPVELVLISENDFERALETVYRAEYVNESVSALLERSPRDSANHILEKGQIVGLIALGVLTVGWLIYDALSFVVVANALITLFYLLFSIYKFRLIFMAISSNLEIPVSDEEVAALTDSDLPVYTILVPVHREAEVLADILKSLASIDYPGSQTGYSGTAGRGRYRDHRPVR